MIHLARAYKASEPRSTIVKIAAWVYAAALAVMAVTQLFAFHEFIPLVANYGLPDGYGTAMLVGCVIVLSEIFALPYLLRMPLSPLFRWCSLLCSVVAPLLWLWLTLMMPTGNSGLLGAKIDVPAGPVQFVAVLVLAVLAVWVAWGLRPERTGPRK